MAAVTINNPQREYSAVQYEALYNVNQVNRFWVVCYNAELKLLLQAFFLILNTAELPQEFV